VSDHCSTLEVARLLGMAVRSVQMMVDRGELEAWKTPGGHRRILRASVERWRASRQGPVLREHAAPGTPPPVSLDAAGDAPAPPAAAQEKPRVLLIEDSKHFQNLVTLLFRQQFPEVELHVADDGIAGLAMAGRWQPRLLLVDILLPGIDGATLITSLRSHPQFAGTRLIVVTSLDEAGLQPYAFALEGLPVLHKSRLVAGLPPLVRESLAR
jgi:excisionase family DNA binding protein